MTLRGEIPFVSSLVNMFCLESNTAFFPSPFSKRGHCVLVSHSLSGAADALCKKGIGLLSCSKRLVRPMGPILGSGRPVKLSNKGARQTEDDDEKTFRTDP